MVRVEVTSTSIRAVDRMDRAVTVDAVGWDEVDPIHRFPYHYDERISGRVTRLTFPAVVPLLETVRSDANGVEALTQRSLDGSIDLPNDDYCFAVETRVSVQIRFEGSATIALDDETAVIEFDQPTPVTIGFASRLRYPRTTVTVPRTVEGVATAIEATSSALETTGYRRPTVTERRHPPRIEFGESTSVPDEVKAGIPETGLTIRLPPSLRHCLVAAPLAYYLSAAVTIDANEPPSIVSEDGTIDHQFEAPPAFGFQVMALLRRVFTLDNIVRFNQGEGNDIRELDLLSLLDLDVDACLDCSDTERLRRYLDVDLSRADPALPDWHFVSFVDPCFDRVGALPYLLRYLSGILHPDSASALVGDNTLPGGVPSTTVSRRLAHGGPHGSALAWLSDREPPDWAFLGSEDGFEHSTEHLGRGGEAHRILVVATDDDRRNIAKRSREMYRNYGPDDAVVSLHTAPTVGRLRSLLDEDVDLMHVVGDCSDGIHCRDGVYHPDRNEPLGTRMVILDGPSSASVGSAFVEHGSAGAIVSRRGPISAVVRETLLGLLCRGATLEQAVRYASHSHSPGLLAVGDGFQQLARSEKLYVVHMDVTAVDGGQFQVDIYPYIPEAGFNWYPGLDGERPVLCANRLRTTVSGPQLQYLVNNENAVPIVNGTVHWDRTQPVFGAIH